MSAADARPPVSRLGLTIGLAALASGVWLILNATGVDVPDFKRVWPALLLLAGIAALCDLFFLTRRPAAAGWAVLWIGLGVLAFALTLGYSDMWRILDWLPSVPTIVGLALLASWAAEGAKTPQLALAGAVLLVLGVLGFAVRFEWLRRILPSAPVIWAVLLIVGGGYMAWRTVRRMRG